MNFLDQITVLILTYDEAPNIGRTLDRLRRFEKILVVDSGSRDGTQEIAQRFRNVRLVTRPFDTHANQWNYGLSQCDDSRPWTFALDADYLVSETLVAEIANLSPGVGISGYSSSFRYCVFGKPLTGNLYTPAVTLFLRQRALYFQAGHTQRLLLEGVVVSLHQKIDHDDRKSLKRWLASQQKYAALEAQHLLTTPKASLRRSDRVRLLAWPAPLLVFIHASLINGCIFDGIGGWFYILQRVFVEILIILELIESKMPTRSNSSPQPKHTCNFYGSPLFRGVTEVSLSAGAEAKREAGDWRQFGPLPDSRIVGDGAGACKWLP